MGLVFEFEKLLMLGFGERRMKRVGHYKALGEELGRRALIGHWQDGLERKVNFRNRQYAIHVRRDETHFPRSIMFEITPQDRKMDLDEPKSLYVRPMAVRTLFRKPLIQFAVTLV